ncbi:hypothetical protein D7V86_16635 [bacterium D16-51]|nr:hypothetical protein D7V96_18705 [bacterium D16-59]RKI57984.1 hypothetical protein D7V86_16635 [bacterium D16-51]
MKWVIRIFAIAGVVLCVCGFAMTGIGYAFGGGEYIRSVDLVDIKDVFWADIKDGLGKISGTGGGIKVDTGKDTGIVQEGKKNAASINAGSINTWEAEDIKLNSVSRIEVDFDYIDLKIARSDDSDFHLSYKLQCMNSKNPLSYSLDHGVLKLTEGNFKEPGWGKGTWGIGSWSVWYGGYYSLVTLYIPDNTVLEGCNLRMAKGGLTVHGLCCNLMELELQDGDVVIRESSFSKAAIQTADGDITFSDSKVSGSLQVDTEDGDAVFSGTRVKGAIKIDSADGDMTFSKLDAGRGIDIDTADGDVYLSNFKTSGVVQIDVSDGDVALSGVTVPGVMDIQTECGDVDASGLNVDGEMHVLTEEGDVGLTRLSITGKVVINSEYGDISVQVKKNFVPHLKIKLNTEEGDLSAARSLGGKKTRGHYEKSGSGKAYLQGNTEEGDITIR